MAFKTAAIKDLENFVIENNILKGAKIDRLRELKANDFGQIILDVLNSKPNHVAQIEAKSGKQTTFGEMKDRSVRCGVWLKRQGVGCGDIVVLCSHNHLDTYAPILATFYTGATLSSWNHITTMASAQRLIKLFRPKVIFTCESAALNLLEAAKSENVNTTIVVFGKHTSLQSFNDIVQSSSKEEVEAFTPERIKNAKDTIANIPLSSGSTGFPKGVMHSYETILRYISYLSIFTTNVVMLWYSTTYWMTGFGYTLQNILTYGNRIIHAKFDPEETCKVIEKYKVQQALLLPSYITYLCQSNVLKKYNLQSLEYIFTGGYKINSQLLKEFRMSLPNTFVSQLYGMTEAGSRISSQTKACKSMDSLGFIFPEQEIKIVDLETNEALGPNEPGEIFLKTPNLMVSYYKNPEATKEAVDEDGWLHTGDKGYYNENGELFIIDRLKEVMKCRGHHVSPTEIEQVLLSHPGVIEVAVVPIPDDVDGARPLAFVKKVSNINVTEEDLIKLTSSALGEIKSLSGGVKFLEDLPKTITGKIARSELKEMAKTLA